MRGKEGGEGEGGERERERERAHQNIKKFTYA